jgi:hypothetical protein
MKYIRNNSSFIIHATVVDRHKTQIIFEFSKQDFLLMETLLPLSNKLADYHHKKMWNVIHNLDKVQVLSTPSFNAR